MEHYQVKKPCGVCGKEIIADIFSNGTPHQFIQALTHAECAVHTFEGVEQINASKVHNPPTPEK